MSSGSDKSSGSHAGASLGSEVFTAGRTVVVELGVRMCRALLMSDTTSSSKDQRLSSSVADDKKEERAAQILEREAGGSEELAAGFFPYTASVVAWTRGRTLKVDKNDLDGGSATR